MAQRDLLLENLKLGDVNQLVCGTRFLKRWFRAFFRHYPAFQAKTGRSKLKTAFGDVLRSGLPSKAIKPAEQVAVNLLQALHRAYFDRVQ